MLGNFPTKFLTRNNQSIEFEVYLYDRSGRKFTNFTSLNVEWSVTEASGLMSIDLLAANRPRFPYLYTEGSQLIAQLIKGTTLALFSNATRGTNTMFRHAQLQTRTAVQFGPQRRYASK